MAKKSTKGSGGKAKGGSQPTAFRMDSKKNPPEEASRKSGGGKKRA